LQSRKKPELLEDVDAVDVVDDADDDDAYDGESEAYLPSSTSRINARSFLVDIFNYFF